MAVVNQTVQVVEDGSLGTPSGWAFAECEATGEQHFLIEETAARSAASLSDAWRAGQQLAIERAVRAGIVEYVDSERRPGSA